MTIKQDAHYIATDFVNNIKTEKAKQYSLANIFLWTLAISSMSALLIQDLTHLTDQYLSGQSVFNQDLTDASKEIINLPNMTVCIRYYKQNVDEEISFDKFESYMNFSKFHLKQAFMFAQRISYTDHVTTTLRNWNQSRKNFHGNQPDGQLIDVVLKNRTYGFNYTEENLHEFWNNLAFVVCKNMNPILNMVNDGRWTKILDFCKQVQLGNLPIVPADQRTLCFRVPLEMITIQTSSEDSENFANEVADNESVLFGRPMISGKKIVFSFQPLLIRQLLFPDEKMEYLPVEGTHYKLVAFLPETTASYSSVGFDLPEDQWSARSSQFYREFYYKTGYARNAWLPIEISISKKETRLNDYDCVDIFNETACIIGCKEIEFTKSCKCRRFSYRFYTQTSNVSNYPFCSLQNYHQCSDNYKKFLMNSQMSNDASGNLECQKKCKKCRKIKYDTYNDADFFESSVIPQYVRSKVFQEFFNSKLNNNETFVDKFYKRDLDMMNTSYTIMDGYVNEIVEYADKVGGLTKQEYYETLFGRVYFVITVNTNNFYPNIVETYAVTPDAYRSQIGGILGLYLGCSCISAFIVIIKFLKCLKKRWVKRQEKKKSLTLHSTAMLNLWRIIGRNEQNEEGSDTNTIYTVEETRF